MTGAANSTPRVEVEVEAKGNAVVPQQFYPIFKAIHEVESMVET